MNGEHPLAEMYVPGGLPFAESEAVPWLADFECRHCGRIGEHTDGCHSKQLMEEAMSVTECKIDFCENEAPAKGRYARLCAEHRQAVPSVEPEPQADLSEELLAAVAAVPPSEEPDELVAAAQAIVTARHALSVAWEELAGRIADLRQLLDQQAEGMAEAANADFGA